jgi:hypothetical protein
MAMQRSATTRPAVLHRATAVYSTSSKWPFSPMAAAWTVMMRWLSRKAGGSLKVRPGVAMRRHKTG